MGGYPDIQRFAINLIVSLSRRIGFVSSHYQIDSWVGVWGASVGVEMRDGVGETCEETLISKETSQHL